MSTLTLRHPKHLTRPEWIESPADDEGDDDSDDQAKKPKVRRVYRPPKRQAQPDDAR